MTSVASVILERGEESQGRLREESQNTLRGGYLANCPTTRRFFLLEPGRLYDMLSCTWSALKPHYSRLRVPIEGNQAAEWLSRRRCPGHPG